MRPSTTSKGPKMAAEFWGVVVVIVATYLLFPLNFAPFWWMYLAKFDYYYLQRLKNSLCVLCEFQFHKKQKFKNKNHLKFLGNNNILQWRLVFLVINKFIRGHVFWHFPTEHIFTGLFPFKFNAKYVIFVMYKDFFFIFFVYSKLSEWQKSANLTFATFVAVPFYNTIL